MATALANVTYDVPVLNPIGIGLTNLNTVWQEILPADPQRRGVVIHNPGLSNMFVTTGELSSASYAPLYYWDFTVVPQPTFNSQIFGTIIIYPQSELILFAENEHTNVNSSWSGYVEAGTNQPCSILNFTSNNQSVPPPQPESILSFGTDTTSPIGGGIILGTSSTFVIGPNSQRRGITFQNPGTNSISVCPANLTATYGMGGAITILPGQSKTIKASRKSRTHVNCGFNGAAQTGFNNPISVFEWL